MSGLLTGAIRFEGRRLEQAMNGRDNAEMERKEFLTGGE